VRPPSQFGDGRSLAVSQFRSLVRYHVSNLQTNKQRRIAPASQVGISTFYTHFKKVNTLGWTASSAGGSSNNGEQSEYKRYAVQAGFDWMVQNFGTEKKSEQQMAGVHCVELLVKPVYMVDIMSHGERHEYISEYLLSHQYQTVGIDRKTGNTGTVLTVSKAYCKRHWKKRLKEKEPFEIQVRLQTGKNNGCSICCELYLQWKAAPRKEKQACMDERIDHRQFIRNQRINWDTNCRDDLHNPSVEIMANDGYDSFKCKCPSYAYVKGAELEGLSKYFWSLKISACISFGNCCVFVISAPWVRTGANLSTTAMVQNVSCPYVQDEQTHIKLIYGNSLNE
jgi:hypothetical protein